MSVVLITGGARSGKSRYALTRAADARPKAFIATAEPSDDEMRRWIARHRVERGSGFHTVEAPVDLAAALACLSSETQIAVVDCLTVWLGNLVHRRGFGAPIPS